MTSVRCDAKAADPSKRAARWRRIAMEATKQCGRTRLMQIEDVIEFRALIDRTNDAPELTRIHFSERDGESFDAVAGATKILAFIGPEGGWDDAEIEKATAAGIISITFGGRILKADTAAISISLTPCARRFFIWFCRITRNWSMAARFVPCCRRRLHWRSATRSARR